MKLHDRGVEMKRVMGLACGALASIMLVTAASADWIYNEQAGETEAENSYMAMAIGEARAVAVRCRADGLDFLYVTPDKTLFDVLLEAAQVMAGTLVLTVDGGEASRLDADMWLRRDGAAMIVAALEPEVATDIMRAGQTVAVSAELDGASYAELSFPATGSVFAVMSVMDNCPYERF